MNQAIQTPDTTEPRPEPDDWLHLDRQLCFSLYAASLAMTRRYRSLLEPLGLTYPQYLVMLSLWEQDARSVGDLGAALALDSGTLTPLLKRLEAVGLVSRRRSREDERRVDVLLTPAGQALRESARPIPLRMAAMTGCTLDDMADLRQQLNRLRLALDNVSPPTDPT